MASSSSLSSSTSLPLASYSFQNANPMLLMGNLLSVVEGSDAAIQQEVLKTSLAVSKFMELMTKQFQGMTQRMAELESEVITARAQSQEAKKMHEAQMRAIEKLTTIVTTQTQELGALKSEMSTMKANLQIVKNKGDTHTHLLYLYTSPYHSDSYGGRLIVSNPGQTFISYYTEPPK